MTEEKQEETNELQENNSEEVQNVEITEAHTYDLIGRIV